ncbi:MAG: GbsR/MarR family transcriptional regulator [Nanobdellota archaeon]
MLKQKEDQEYIDLIKELARSQGSDALSGEIYAILYLSRDKVSMDEIAEETGYSLATISNKLKFLEMANIIERTKKPGSRKHYVYMKKDLIEIHKQNLINAQKNSIKKIKEKLPDIIKNYRKKKKHDKEKLSIMKNHLNQAGKIDKVMDKIIKELEDEKDN